MAHSFNDFQVTKDDIETLIGMLAGVKRKWEAIFIQCKVPYSDLLDIKNTPMNWMNDYHLNCCLAALSKWISEGKENAKFSILISALRSQNVGEGALANEIIENRLNLPSSRGIKTNKKQNENNKTVNKSSGTQTDPDDGLRRGNDEVKDRGRELGAAEEPVTEEAGVFLTLDEDDGIPEDAKETTGMPLGLSKEARVYFDSGENPAVSHSDEPYSTDWKLIKMDNPEFFETECTRECLKMDEKDDGVSLTGKGARLAIIDFGFYSGSKALNEASRITFNSETESISIHNETDGLAHGTVVASIAAGRVVLSCVKKGQASLAKYPGGVARGAALKCFSISTKKEKIIEMLEKIAEAKEGVLPSYDVVSLSLVVKRSDRLDNAFQKLLDQDIIVLAGCGNKGDSEEIGYPSCLEGVVSVGSLKYRGKISDFTRETPPHADIFVYGEVLAPYGENQGDQGASLCCHQGTSMAAPAAAGLACLAIEYINTYCKRHHPDIDPLLLRRKRKKVIMDVFQRCGRDGEEKYRIHSAKKNFMSYIEDKTAHTNFNESP